MKQKIKDFLEKMTGMQRIIFGAFCTTFFINAVYVVTFFFTGSKEIALITTTLAVIVAFAALATFAVAAFFAADFTTTLATAIIAALATIFAAVLVTALATAFATFATAFATLAALATFAFAFVALATFFVALAAVDVTQKYKVKYWKVFSVYLVEATLLYLSFTCIVSYSTIIVLCFSLLGISYFVSTHYLKTYLVKNPPSEKPRSTKRVDYYGNHPMRLASVTTEIPPLPEPLKTKAYRFVHERLI